MTYLEVYADILKSKAQAVVNTVNCQGVMGKGIALAFKNKYPRLFVDYRTYCKDGKLKPGGLYVWRTGQENPSYVLNVATKDTWRMGSSYEWVQGCIDRLVEFGNTNGLTTMAIPKLGCSNGGLEWSKVKRMILDAPFSEDLILTVYDI